MQSLVNLAIGISRHCLCLPMFASFTMSNNIGINDAPSNANEVAPAAVAKVKKERKTGAGTTAWTEREYLLASRSWIKTSTEMMGIKANLSDFDCKWAEYYNQMKDAQEVVETQVRIYVDLF
jgi:hypothetical protein